MRLASTLFLLITVVLMCPAQVKVSSPDGAVTVTVSGGETLQISAQFKGNVLLDPSAVGLLVRNQKINWNVRKSGIQRRDDFITSHVPEKRKTIRDHYHELTVQFRSQISLHVRAYNDGFSYRFASNINDSITVDKEIAAYSIPGPTKFYGSPVTKREDVDIFHTS